LLCIRFAPKIVTRGFWWNNANFHENPADDANRETRKHDMVTRICFFRRVSSDRAFCFSQFSERARNICAK
jgi:hypothetical protein